MLRLLYMYIMFILPSDQGVDTKNPASVCESCEKANVYMYSEINKIFFKERPTENYL